MSWLSKIIPLEIRIKSLYWVQREKEINKDLDILFSRIDNDAYLEAAVTLQILRDKWIPISHAAPEWFVLEYIPQFARARSMLDFLITPPDNN